MSQNTNAAHIVLVMQFIKCSRRLYRVFFVAIKTTSTKSKLLVIVIIASGEPSQDNLTPPTSS